MRRRMIHDIEDREWQTHNGSCGCALLSVIVGINQTNGDFYRFTRCFDDACVPEIFSYFFFIAYFFSSLLFSFLSTWRRASLASVEEDFLETSFPNKGKYQILQRGNVRRVKCLRDRITRSIPWFKFVVTRGRVSPSEKPLIGFPLVFVDIALPNLASFFFFVRGAPHEGWMAGGDCCLL